MNCILHVIGTDTVDLTPSLMLACGNKKYLFNSGEGTQRLCLEHFVRMGQLDTVFFSRLNWEEIGGFPGMLLTTSETGMKALTVCGPPGIEDFVTSTRFFLQRNDFVMHIREFKGNSPPAYEDPLMKIYPIVLDPSLPPPSPTESEEKEEGDEQDDEDEEHEGMDVAKEEEEEKREQLTGIAYIPSARKNQKLFVQKKNVEQVVSLMFSKRRQLTEYEEIEANIEFYDTNYEGRKKAKKAKKNENMNFMKDTIKMRLTCNDAKLLVHEDYFGTNPNLATNDESDDEAEVKDPNVAPVGVMADLRPIVESNSNNNNTNSTNSNNSNNNNNSNTINDNRNNNDNNNENNNNNNKNKNNEENVNTDNKSNLELPTTPPLPSTPLLSSTSSLPSSLPTSLFPSSSNFTFTVGTSFDSSSLASFPSISTTSRTAKEDPLPFVQPFSSSLFGQIAEPAFQNPFTSPFSFTASVTSSTTTSSPFPSSASFPFSSPSTNEQDQPVTDIFGKEFGMTSVPGSSQVFEFDSKIGNAALFEGVSLVSAPEPVEVPKEEITIDTEKRSSIVICYACHMQDIVRLDFDKASAFGIPQGPLLEQLREGKTVRSPTTDNFVSPQDCMGDPIPGPAFLVIFCPSLEYMPYIIYNKTFKKYFEKIEYVVHLTHHDALSTDAYKKWMNKFNTIQHIIINREVCTHHYVYPTSAIHQYKMNALDNDIFPLPYYKSPTAVLPNKCNCSCGAESVVPIQDPRDFHGLPDNTSVGEIFLQMILYPHQQQGIDRSGVILRGSVERGKIAVNSLSKIADLEQQVTRLQIYKTEKEKRNPIPISQPRLLFLGTASALPSKYRNVSGTYFEPVPGSAMLLDAGEGSYGMLYRRFGEKLKEAILTLKAAWISHIHADHHLGLIRILLKRKECNASSPLMVIGPRPVGRWLAEYDQKIQNLFYDFVDCADITSSCNFITPFFENTFGFKEIYTMEVAHCAEAFGLVITHKDGWKFVISGDTRPCPKIEEVGKNAFLLIHEATLETGLEKDAHERGHSTCGQALDCFKKMNAEWVILTHFSQRYPSIPKLPDDSRDKVGIAYDLMDIKWSDVPILPRLLKPMALILDHEERARASAAQRTRDYYAEREKTLVQERARAKRIKFHFHEDDEEEEERDPKNPYARFGGKGGVRGFCVDPTKRRGKVDR